MFTKALLGLRRAGQWLMLAAALLVGAMPNGSALCLPWLGHMHLHIGLAMHADAPQDVYTVYLHPFGEPDDHAHHGHEHHGAEHAPVQGAGVYDGPTFMPGNMPVSTSMPAPLIPWAGTLGAIVVAACLWRRVAEAAPHGRHLALTPLPQPPRFSAA